jgi:hypothetical protein
MDARSIVRQARRDAGRSPDAARAGRALAQAAADHRQTLTPNEVAMARAGVAATKLDAYLESLRGHATLNSYQLRDGTRSNPNNFSSIMIFCGSLMVS